MENLARLHVLDAGQIEELTARVASLSEAKLLARELIDRGWLMPYQANLLLQGRGNELLLGSYVLLEKLGEGGMGTVYRARNWKLGRIAAIKLIRRERLSSVDAVRRFEREIRAASQLEHPNVVRAYDADEVNGTHFFAMEFVDGIDLSRLVKQHGVLPPGLACEYIRQAALGLQHAHERGMVHRDIKPGNLLLARAQGNNIGTVKVLDMGLARLDTTVSSEYSATLTQVGMLMGTPDFMAPEQSVSARTVDIRADLYSLGCSLYYLLTGSVPFPGGALTEKLLKHQLDQPKPIEMLRPDVPSTVADVVYKLMAKKPADRYQTPGELAAVLDEVARGVDAAGAGQAFMAGSPSPHRGRGTGGEGKRPESSDGSEYQTDQFWQRVVKEVDSSPPTPPATANKRPWALVAAGGGGLVLLAIALLLLFGGRRPVVTPIEAQAPKEIVNDLAKLAELPPFEVPASAVKLNLLPLIDVAKDGVSGGWSVEAGGEVSCDSAPAARLCIPYRPPVEFDLHTSFTRLDGDSDNVHILAAGGRQFVWTLGTAKNTAAGLGLVDGRPADANPTTIRKRAWLDNGIRYKLLIQVRHDAIRVFFDNQCVADFSTDNANLALNKDWSLTDNAALGLGSSMGRTVFHRVEVVEINGAGSFVRPNDVAARRAVEYRAAATGTRPALALAPFDKAQAEHHQACWAAYLKRPTVEANSIGMKLVLIPPGEFLMGTPDSEPGRDSDERPQHRVVITKPFLFGMVEVTVAQFKKFIQETNYETTAEKAKGRTWREFAGSDDLPAVCIGWDDAVAYCQWLSKKEGKKYVLPTEARWEYACRAGTRTRFHFGDNEGTLGEYGWYSSNSGNKCSVVGKKKPSPWGQHDLYGNVWEWTADWWDQFYYSVSPTEDPPGGNGVHRAARGGPFNEPAKFCWSAYRRTPYVPSPTTGFRVACEIDVPTPSPVLQPPPALTREQAEELQRSCALIFNTDVVVTNSIGMKLALIPASEFLMGDVANPANPTAPPHRVRITKPYRIGVHEVTAGQYARVTGVNPSEYQKGPEYPVEHVYWHEAVAFCQKLSALPEEQKAGRRYRLPTEAEWEFACRAGTTTPFSFGETLTPDQANFNDGKNRKTVPVGGYPANAFGLHDMHGNVWEWVNDWWDGGYYRTSPEADPAGPATGTRHSVRGGSFWWSLNEPWVKSWARKGEAVTWVCGDLGFRVVCDIDPPSVTPPPVVAAADVQARELQKQWADKLKRPVIETNSIGMKLALIPPGKFWMGSPPNEPGRDWDEARHEVTITKPYYLGVYEVTVGQFKKFVAETGYKTDLQKGTGVGQPMNAMHAQRAIFSQTDDEPIVHVSWNDARAFCEWLTVRDWLGMRRGRKYMLPTEAQWEHACRAGTDTAFFFGSDEKELGQYAWYSANAEQETHRVGEKRPNPWGLHDVHGNVFEWTANWWNGNYEVGPKEDPLGPSSSKDNHRISRGGAWSEATRFCRSAYRNGYRCPWEAHANTGFRVLCAIDVEQPLVAPQPSPPGAEAAKPRAVALLPLIDPVKDRVDGEWRFNETGELLSPTVRLARIRIPYRPPAEYDLRITFTRTDGPDGMTQILIGGGRQFRCEIGGYGNTLAHFELVNGLSGNNNPSTARRNAWIVTGKQHESLVQVRKDGLKAFFDGELVLQFTTTFANMSMHKQWDHGDATVLGLGTYLSPMTFHRVEIDEISGAGTLARP